LGVREAQRRPRHAPEEPPQTPGGPEAIETREGEPIDLDPPTLERLASVCAAQEQDRLRLPITVHFSADVADSAFVLDGLAADVLHRLEGWGEAYPYRDGKMWLPQSLAVDLLLRYGGALQRLVR